MGFKILNFNICLGFQKNEYCLGYENFEDILWGSSQNWASLRVISMHLKVFFLKVKVHNWDIFFGLLKFQFFLGVLEIPIIFWG